MKHFAACCFRAGLLAVLLFGFAGTVPAAAEELPAAAVSDLQRILKDPQFYGREEEEPFFLKLLKPYKQRVKQWIDDFVERLSLLPEKFEGTWFERAVLAAAPALEFFFGNLWKLLAVTAFILAIILLVRADWSRILPRRRFEESAVLSIAPAGHPAERPSAVELFRSGRYLDALTVLRQDLRAEIMARHTLLDSATDREIIRKIGTADERSKLFLRVARLFERYVFAGQSIEPENIAQLFAARAE